MVINGSQPNTSFLGDFFGGLAKEYNIDTPEKAAAKAKAAIAGIIKKPSDKTTPPQAPLIIPQTAVNQVSEALKTVDWKMIGIGTAAIVGLIYVMRKGKK